MPLDRREHQRIKQPPFIIKFPSIGECVQPTDVSEKNCSYVETLPDGVEGQVPIKTELVSACNKARLVCDATIKKVRDDREGSLIEFELDENGICQLNRIRGMGTIITTSHPRYTKYKESPLLHVTATIKPSQCNKIVPLLESGVSLFRLNLSHYEKDDKEQWEYLVRAIWAEISSNKTPAAIMLDTAGPEFRIRSDQKSRTLREDTKAKFSISPEADGGTDVVYIEAPQDFREFSDAFVEKQILIKDMKCGEIVAAERHTITVLLCQDTDVKAKNKVNFPGVLLPSYIPSCGEKESKALNFFLKISKDSDSHGYIPIDYIAQSFVRSIGDVTSLFNMINSIDIGTPEKPLIILKLETRQSVEHKTLEEIIKSDKAVAIMIARGDLANETSLDKVPRLQRSIIATCHKYWKPVLIATQVYGSMEDTKVRQCSRPEAEDIRSALDWAVDGVVLTGETAQRLDPEYVVGLLLKQAAEDEVDIQEKRLHDHQRNLRREEFETKYKEMLDGKLKPEDEFPLRNHEDFSTADMAVAAVHRANNRNAAAIFPMTNKGNTVRDIVHFLPYRPVFAFTQDRTTLSRLLLYRGVFPTFIELHGDPGNFDINNLKYLMHEAISRFKIGGGEDLFAVGTMAHPVSMTRGTDTLVWIRRNKKRIEAVTL